MSMRVHALAAVLAAALLAPAAPAIAAPGDLDSTFGGSGMQLTHFGPESAAFGVAIQPDGKIVTAGTSNYEQDTGLYLGEFGVSRHNADGSLDGSFSDDGRQTTSFGPNLGAYAQAVALQADGKIVVAGNQRESNVENPYVHLAVVRYRADGTLDPTFSGDGKLTLADFGDYSTANAVAIQADGKIVVAGGAALVRLNTDGSFDPGFSDDGKVSTSLDAQAMAIQADGKIVLAGGYGFRLARYRADGSPDPAFSGDGNVITDLPGLYYARSVALQADGRIVVAGGAATSGGSRLRDGALPLRRRARHSVRDRRRADHGRTRCRRLRRRRRDPVRRQDRGRGASGLAGTGTRRSSAGSCSPACARTDHPTARSGPAAQVLSTIGFSSHATAAALQPDGKIVLVGIGTTFESGSSMLSARYQGDAPAANVAPTARYAFSCSGLNCYLDARASSDPEGPVAGYRWDFSDGTSATGSYVRKVFAQYGIYSATLTVTDGSGATGTRAQALTLLRLTATGSLVGGVHTVQLSWNGTPGTIYGVYRGGKRVGLLSGNTLTDRPPFAASGTYSFTVCEAYGPYCSATETVRIPSRVRQAVQPAGRVRSSGYFAR